MEQRAIYAVIGFLVFLVLAMAKELFFGGQKWSEAKENYNEKLEKFRKDSNGKPVAYFVNLANELIRDYRKRK